MAAAARAACLVESLLAQLSKVLHSTGSRGGRAYYIEKGLGQRWMAVLFAVVLILTFPLVFNAVQSNTITGALANSAEFFGAGTELGFSAIVGVGLVFLTGLVIFGGVRRIANTAHALIPFFAALSVVVGL